MREVECVQRTDVLERLAGHRAGPAARRHRDGDYLLPAAQAIVDALPDADLVELTARATSRTRRRPVLADTILDFAT